jgi:hypothetical protein
MKNRSNSMRLAPRGRRLSLEGDDLEGAAKGAIGDPVVAAAAVVADDSKSPLDRMAAIMKRYVSGVVI